MRPIRAVLFDWGDTLFSPPDAADAIVRAAAARGVPVELEAAGEVWEELWDAGKAPDELGKGRDLSADAHRDVWTALFRRAERIAPGIAEEIYARVMDPRAWIPYPDTKATLQALRERGLAVGIVSNVPIDLREVFASHGLRDLVDAFTHSFEVGAEKPDPRIFLAACERLRVEPHQTLMVGDHPVADGGAADAGLAVLILPPPGPPDEARGLDAVLAYLDADQ